MKPLISRAADALDAIYTTSKLSFPDYARVESYRGFSQLFVKRWRVRYKGLTLAKNFGSRKAAVNWLNANHPDRMSSLDKIAYSRGRIGLTQFRVPIEHIPPPLSGKLRREMICRIADETAYATGLIPLSDNAHYGIGTARLARVTYTHSEGYTSVHWWRKKYPYLCLDTIRESVQMAKEARRVANPGEER